jgi:S1-C subfamily serine protease
VIDGLADGASPFARIPDTVERVQPSIVSVLVRTDQGFSEGSGVVWNTDAGQIITNNHVVDGALEVEVALSSGERLPATVRATDAFTDLAVIEVERSDLPAATFADELPRVGELAIALGNALGFENSVTAAMAALR